MSYLRGFDYASYLKRHLMVGQVDPWRIDDQGKPYFALLVSLDTAMLECKGWSNQDISKTEFVNHLKVNNIWVLRDITELQQIREDRKEVIREEKEAKKRYKRNISEEARKARSERMRLLNNEKRNLDEKSPLP